MQVITTQPTAPATPASGPLGQQNQAADSPLAIFTALLVQAGISLTAGKGTPLADGQIVPTGDKGANLALPNLPINTLVDADAATAAQSTASPAALQLPEGTDLLALLQSLSANTTLSPELKTLLAGDHVDLDTIKDRLAKLDDKTRDAVMSEIAGLLQPMLAAPVMPIKVGPGMTPETPVAGVTAPAPKPAAPEQGQFAGTSTAPQSTTEPVPPSPDDLGTPVQAGGTDLPVPAPTPPGVDAKAATTTPAATDKAQADLLAAANAKDTRTNSQRAADKAQADAVLAARTATATPAASDTAQVTAAIQAAASSSGAAAGQASLRIVKKADSDDKPAQAAPVAAAVAPTATSKTVTAAQPTAEIKPVSANEGKKPEAAIKELLTNAATTATPQAVQPKEADGSFASHLNTVQLNRTGAHTPVAEQITVHLAKAVADGNDRFTVKLTPAGLGRVEIKIDMASDGRVTASFHVDQASTLDLLQRDQRGIERMLSDAGLKTDSGSLNFNLRGDGNPQQQGGQQAQNNNSGNSNNQPNFNLNGDLVDDTPIAGTLEATWYVDNSRLDLHV